MRVSVSLILGSLTGPVAAPSDLGVSDIESSTLTVHWEPVSRADIMGEIKEYKVSLLRCTGQLICMQ